MLNHMAINKPAEATAVLAWSSVDFNYDQGIEYLRHYVSFCDDDMEPVGKWTEFYSIESAENYGYNLAGRYDLDLETDFMW